MDHVPTLTSETRLEAEAVGLMAGWGEYPVVVARSLKKQGYRVIGVGIRGHADPERPQECDEFTMGPIGKVGMAIRFFKQHNAHHITFAGKIHKVKIFQKFAWLDYIPDRASLRMFYDFMIAKKNDRKDDTFLLAFVNLFERHGVSVLPATHFAPELLVKQGNLTGSKLSKSQQLDIRFGWELAKQMGGLDVGQTVVVKNQAVLAVEAVEGTDLCIQRAGELCQQGGFTVVKVAKPQQDSRFDVPAVGVGTLESIKKAGGNCLAIEAGHTIIINQPDVVAYARKNKITVVALNDGLVSAEHDQRDAA
ncbi:MAG: UDP-2,3-diacylglucosamine diphosphatase LpxI [Planctomycetota bacterium]|nr:UDP-2,3-diacylglucosamine diphosphatase LpxI [Planctomycetota bacterium]